MTRRLYQDPTTTARMAVETSLRAVAPARADLRPKKSELHLIFFHDLSGGGYNDAMAAQAEGNRLLLVKI